MAGTRTSRKPKQAPAKRGRQGIYCEEIAAKICGLIGDGVPLAAVAEMVGVGKTTICKWRQDRPDFRDRYRKAQLESIGALVRCVRTAAATDTRQWKAAAYLLERLMPEAFPSKADVVVNQAVAIHNHPGEKLAKWREDLLGGGGRN